MRIMEIVGKSLLLLISLVAVPLYSQEITMPAQAAYLDFLFNEYIELEDQILQKGNTTGFETADIDSISELRKKAEDSNREDIVSRLGMLEFVVKTEIKNAEQSVLKDIVLGDIAETEYEYQKKLKAQRISRTGVNISIGTALVSGVVFTVGTLLYSDFYSKYTETEYADQAAYYLFWWQFFEKASFTGAVLSAVSITTAGLFSLTL